MTNMLCGPSMFTAPREILVCSSKLCLSTMSLVQTRDQSYPILSPVISCNTTQRAEGSIWKRIPTRQYPATHDCLDRQIPFHPSREIPRLGLTRKRFARKSERTYPKSCSATNIHSKRVRNMFFVNNWIYGHGRSVPYNSRAGLFT